MVDLPDKEVGCHRTGFAQGCRDLVVSGRCRRWMQIQGANPNTGDPLTRHACIDDWGPLLTIENSQQQRQTGASCDKVATEVRRFHDSMREMNGAPPIGWDWPAALKAPQA